MEDQETDIFEVVGIEVEPQPGEKLKNFFKELFETLLIAVFLILVIEGLSDRVKIEGSSMLPSLHQNDRVIVSKVSYRSKEIERGDILVFDYPNNPDEEYIKRVVAIPGDTISIRDGKLVLNGDVLVEPYIENYILGEFEEITVSENTVFVLGDNRNHSSDSRFWSAVYHQMRLLLQDLSH